MPNDLYEWNDQGFGGTLTRLSDRADVWFRGDDYCAFDDQWDECESAEMRNYLASAYDDIMEVPTP